MAMGLRASLNLRSSFVMASSLAKKVLGCSPSPIWISWKSVARRLALLVLCALNSSSRKLSPPAKLKHSVRFGALLCCFCFVLVSDVTLWQQRRGETFVVEEAKEGCAPSWIVVFVAVEGTEASYDRRLGPGPITCCKRFLPGHFFSLLW